MRCISGQVMRHAVQGLEYPLDQAATIHQDIGGQSHARLNWFWLAVGQHLLAVQRYLDAV
jgi:hypothetical protein